MKNADAYLTADAGKIIEYNDNMNISMEEAQETVKYQKTLKEDVENISKNKCRPIYEVFPAPFF